MKAVSLWQACLSALAGVALLLVLAPILVLMSSASPQGLARTLLEPEVLSSLTLTFACGLAATLLGLLLGTPLAYLLSRPNFPARRLVEGIIDVPIVIPHPVAGIALLLLFSAAGGRWNPAGSWKGIVLAMFFVSVSLLVKTAQEGFHSIPLEMEWTSRSLGVGPARTFFRVSLPMNVRNLLAGAIMMWARSISEFGSIVIVAYNPKVASVLIYDRFSSFGLHFSLPVAVLLIWISLALFFAMRTVQERRSPLARP